MPKTYIGRALASLSHMRDGPQRCDKVAKYLMIAGSGQVSQINKDLDFGLLKWSMRNVQITMGETQLEVADRRRAALLVAHALGLPQPQQAAAASWDSSQHRTVFNACDQAADPRCPAYYLKGSFWGFSNHSEREWIEASWIEAMVLVRHGITACQIAMAVTTGGAPTPEARIADRYFGTANIPTVLRNLRTLRDQMSHNTVGICYQGAGLAGAPNYDEFGPEVHEARMTHNPNSTEWGWASPQSGNHNNIGFASKFYVLADTAISRRTEHDTNRFDMEVTRGGAIVHELTHRYLRTADETVPPQTFQVLQRAPLQGVKAYGPRVCWALAQSSPNLAVTNADSYRLFCEDIKVHR